ncbi:MAG TPA: hypothetical protein VMF29_03540 [Candidatus Edwardsbacteria bacterium]|nr:hypothetical protein [Candidatus Edwardsbacteria bacterium]
MGKAVTIMLAGLLLLVAGAVPGYSQPAGPPYYTSDIAPTADVLSKSLDRYFGKQAGAIPIIGVHKVTETEYLILTGAQDKKDMPPTKTTMYSLWRLESREWVMQDPTMPALRYVKVLALDTGGSKP